MSSFQIVKMIFCCFECTQVGNKEYRSHYSHIRRDVAPGRRGKRELRGRMCVRLLLHEVLMWLMLTHLLQSSLLTSKLKCLLIASSKNKKHTEEQPCTWLLHPRQEEGRGEGGHSAHGYSTQGGKREEERGHTAHGYCTRGGKHLRRGVTLILLW